MREIDRRLRTLEAAKSQAEDAFLTVTFRDGSRRRMLWADAMLLDDVADVEGEGVLPGLVRVFLIQPKEGGNDG